MPRSAPAAPKGRAQTALRYRGSGGASLQNGKMGRIEREEGLKVSYCKGGSPWEAMMGLVSEIRLPRGKSMRAGLSFLSGRRKESG